MGGLSSSVVSGLAVATAALSILALLVAAVALRRTALARREYRRIAHSDGDVVAALLDRVTAIDAVGDQISDLTGLVNATRDEVAHSIRHVAVVRYDAFRELSGRLSFSAALLDDSGDGVVFTSLRGRSESQTIAKGVNAGNTDALTPEEKQAVTYATDGTGGAGS